MTGIAILLAVLGSVCFAGATVLQHRAVSAQAESNRPANAAAGDGYTPAATQHALSLRGIVAAARRPGWLTGLALASAGSGLHATALVLAPLSIVQPLGVLAVPIAVVLTAIHTHRRPGRGVVVGVVICIAGVAAFVATAAGTAVSTPPPSRATLFAGLIVTAVVAVVAAFGLTRSGWLRCVTCATAAAVAFGLVSALVRAVSQSVVAAAPGGLVAAVLDPAVLATAVGIVVALVAGGWLVQQALASGPPEVITACLTVVDPIVAVLLGAVLLGEGAKTPADTWFLLGSAALAAVVGVVALARHHPDAVAARARRGNPSAAAPSSTAPSSTAASSTAAPDAAAPDIAPPTAAPPAAPQRRREPSPFRR